MFFLDYNVWSVGLYLTICLNWHIPQDCDVVFVCYFIIIIIIIVIIIIIIIIIIITALNMCSVSGSVELMLPMISNVFSSFQSNLPVMWTSFESFVNLPVYSIFSYNRSGDRELKKASSRHSNKPIVKTYNANLKGKRRQTETKHKLFFKVIFCQVSLINKRIIYAVLRLASFIEQIDNNVKK